MIWSSISLTDKKSSVNIAVGRSTLQHPNNTVSGVQGSWPRCKSWSFIGVRLKLGPHTPPTSILLNPMDEDWRHMFGILMLPLGAGQWGVALKGPISILYKHSHVAYQIKGNEDRIQKCKNFALRPHLEVTRGHKVGFWIFFFFFFFFFFLIITQLLQVSWARILKLSQVIALWLFVLRFYGPVNPKGSCRAQSVYLTTRLLGRLSPLSG